MSHPLIDARVEINAVNMSDFVQSVELPSEFEALEDTAMGDNARSRIAGLEDSTLSITWIQSFGNSGPDATIWPLRGTVTEVRIQPKSGSISDSNPEYVANYLVNQWNPLANSVGELATSEVEWPLSDPDGMQRNTSS